ncbi:unnamed protein product [Lasius platythorax]|uniref:Uncharacterized protein n=1 Tax=Lasius platythorax TaxID=488582 RepID=A0AAV2MZ43_9HYME
MSTAVRPESLPAPEEACFSQEVLATPNPGTPRGISRDRRTLGRRRKRNHWYCATRDMRGSIILNQYRSMRNADLHYMISGNNNTGLSLERPAIIAQFQRSFSENTSIVIRDQIIIKFARSIGKVRVRAIRKFLLKPSRRIEDFHFELN